MAKNLIPDDVSQYRTQEYWEWRYSQDSQADAVVEGDAGSVAGSGSGAEAEVVAATEETYDWFKGYDYFRDVLLAVLRPEDKILMLGCGNSTVSERLYQEGFENIVNVDYSQAVIRKMSNRTAQSCPKMSWITADFRDMSMFPAGSFTVVLDKGSLDALWSDGGSQWSPSEAVLADIDAALKEVLRVVVKPAGRFVSISFGQPHFRVPFMQRDGWKLVNQQVLGLYYIYTYETV